MQKSILTIFPDLENVHLFKDVGMVPFLLHKNHGYKSAIATFDKGKPFSYAENELKGLEILFIKKIFHIPVLDELLFIARNYKNYNILHSFGFYWKTFLWNTLFKILKGKNSITYIKLDGDANFYKKKYRTGFRGFFYRLSRRMGDIMSAETQVLSKNLTQLWEREIFCIPNGFYNWGNEPEQTYKKKKEIVTSGRIGAYQKYNELLCEAFVSVHTRYPDWSIRFVGGVEAHFTSYIKAYFTKYPHLENVITFTGNITDRTELNKHYEQAAIFALTSRYEGFPLVFPEAINAGCLIVSSDLDAAYDITDNQKYGRIFEMGSAQGLIHALGEVITIFESGLIKPEEIKKFAEQHFNWNSIISKLDGILTQTTAST